MWPFGNILQKNGQSEGLVNEVRHSK